MKTAENIKNVALILFIILGITHITSGLMLSNGYFMPTSMIINRVLDIPFAMTALIYAFMTIYTGIDEKSRKIPSIVMIIITLLIFLTLLYINLFIPDKSSLITTI
ncbi:hypothetical protein KJ951_01240 [Patescibacteria group bacterium]|nr:hypothetical protein [Patescibacteria group bacterium]MBU1703005.1 hypothetical protein [Patescibacteria group bacterium]MBU1954037.1 hypothetical protein [Patescibacteria group bacterium]